MPVVLNMPGLGIWRCCEYVRVRQVVEYALIGWIISFKYICTGEYALIMLHMLEYVCIYLNKQSSEYARILNVPDAVHSIMSPYKLLQH